MYFQKDYNLSRYINLEWISCSLLAVGNILNAVFLLNRYKFLNIIWLPLRIKKLSKPMTYNLNYVHINSVKVINDTRIWWRLGTYKFR